MAPPVLVVLVGVPGAGDSVIRSSLGASGLEEKHLSDVLLGLAPPLVGLFPLVLAPHVAVSVGLVSDAVHALLVILGDGVVVSGRRGRRRIVQDTGSK